MNIFKDKSKLKLAYISPLPPLQSGISDYSEILLNVLRRYYDIELIIDQDQVNDNLKKSYIIHDIEWFRKNSHLFNKVLYHFGNSLYHLHMFSLLREISGVVVLHDFFMSGIFSHLELTQEIPFIWMKNLYYSHGYLAVKKRYIDIHLARDEYPVNLEIIQLAKGIIVHSEYSKQLAVKYYGKNSSKNWQKIPLLRNTNLKIKKRDARLMLNLEAADFIVCSFGFLDSIKLNHRLLKSWSKFLLEGKKIAKLIFVGKIIASSYADEIKLIIKELNLENNVFITDWVNSNIYQQYLSAADAAVQLRINSRGETSAAVLDCLNSELPTIVNANGAFSELSSVWQLPDNFTDSELINALELLYSNKKLRQGLGKKAKKIINKYHSAARCAALYHQVIENFYEKPLPSITPKKQILIDISATQRPELKTEIERGVHNILLALMEIVTPDYRIEPVYLDYREGHWQYCYARQFTFSLLNCPDDHLPDDLILVSKQDILLIFDCSEQILINSAASGLYEKLKAQGVKIYSIKWTHLGSDLNWQNTAENILEMIL